MIDCEGRVRAAVDGLNYDFGQFTISHFTTHVQAQRQREIILRDMSFDRGLHGFWIRAETADYVFSNNDTHRTHQVHHILHELGHIILAHQPCDLSEYLSSELIAQLQTSFASNPHGHCRLWITHDTLEEREAECFVRRLRREIQRAGRLSALTHPDTSIQELGRFTRGLGYDA